MIEELRVLSSRRAYEFGPDGLRLTVLSLQPVQHLIRDAFRFQLAQIGTPQSTFGDVALTVPPGLVYDYGLWVSTDEVATPIRFIHVEPTRIVIDVAGHSDVIGEIYQRFFDLVQEIVAALHLLKEPAVIGTPLRQLEYSEIVFRCSWPIENIFVPKVRNLWLKSTGARETEQSQALEPTVYIQHRGAVEAVQSAVTVSDAKMLQLSPRVGSVLGDRVHFSGIQLDAEAHIQYLRELDEALSTQDTMP